MRINKNKRIVAASSAVVAETIAIYVPLLKILIPAMVLVKIFQLVGGVDLVADAFAPVMNIIGLPSVLSIVWATTLFTNILGRVNGLYFPGFHCLA